MRALLNRMQVFVNAEIDRRKYLKIYHSYMGYTMVPMEHYFDNLMLAKKVVSIPGAVVECGVWRGGMSAGIATILGNSRQYHLFDSFEGLPPATEKDGEAAINYQLDKTGPNYFDNCTAEIGFAQKAMEKTGVTFELHKGWFKDTVPDFKFSEGISLLRLDGDWYDSTMVCLQAFLLQVNTGGVIIIDDYHTWDGCTLAVHDYFAQLQKPFRINTTPNGVSFLFITD